MQLQSTCSQSTVRYANPMSAVNQSKVYTTRAGLSGQVMYPQGMPQGMMVPTPMPMGETLPMPNPMGAPQTTPAPMPMPTTPMSNAPLPLAPELNKLPGRKVGLPAEQRPFTKQS
jgi:hypothetical protein